MQNLAKNQMFDYYSLLLSNPSTLVSPKPNILVLSKHTDLTKTKHTGLMSMFKVPTADECCLIQGRDGDEG